MKWWIVQPWRTHTNICTCKCFKSFAKCLICTYFRPSISRIILYVLLLSNAYFITNVLYLYTCYVLLAIIDILFSLTFTAKICACKSTAYVRCTCSNNDCYFIGACTRTLTSNPTSAPTVIIARNWVETVWSTADECTQVNGRCTRACTSVPPCSSRLLYPSSLPWIVLFSCGILLHNPCFVLSTDVRV